MKANHRIPIFRQNEKELAFQEACEKGSLEMVRQKYAPGLFANTCSLEHLCRRGRVDILKWLYSEGEKPTITGDCEALYYAIYYRKWNVVNWLVRREPPSLVAEMEEGQKTTLLVNIFRVLTELCRLFGVRLHKQELNGGGFLLEGVLEVLSQLDWSSVTLQEVERKGKGELRLFSPRSLYNGVMRYFDRLFGISHARSKSTCRRKRKRKRSVSNGESGGEKRVKMSDERITMIRAGEEITLLKKLGTGRSAFDKVFIKQLSEYLVEERKKGTVKIYIPSPTARETQTWNRVYSESVSRALEGYGLGLDSPIVEFAIERILIVLRSKMKRCTMDYGFKPYGGWFMEGFDPEDFLD